MPENKVFHSFYEYAAHLTKHPTIEELFNNPMKFDDKKKEVDPITGLPFNGIFSKEKLLSLKKSFIDQMRF